MRVIVWEYCDEDDDGDSRTDQGSVGPGFVNRDWDWEISTFGPANEIGTRNSIS